MTNDKKFKIVFIAAEASHDEIVDSIADVFKVGFVIDDALGDGFQFTDLLQLAGTEKEIREIINDVPVFVQQFKQLTPEKAMQVVIEARDRVLQLRPTLGKVSKFIFGSLWMIAVGYRDTDYVLRAAMYQREGWSQVIDGSFTFPDGPPQLRKAPGSQL